MKALFWLAAIIVAIAIFRYFNLRPVARTPEEVAELLKARLNGTQDRGEWDYFMSCEVADERLEEIRATVENLDILGSPYLDDSADDLMALSDLGRQRFRELIQQCEQLSTQ